MLSVSIFDYLYGQDKFVSGYVYAHWVVLISDLLVLAPLGVFLLN